MGDSNLDSIFLCVFYNMLQIDFVGRSELSQGPFLHIDDISFSKEQCKKIPWNPVTGGVKI